MGTVSDKLTYLNNTKTALKDSINLMGVNITDDTFRSYANKIKDGLLDIMNNGTDTVWDNWEKVSASDVAEATLNNTVQAPMEIDVKGDTEQTQLSGKNIFNINDTRVDKGGIQSNVSDDTLNFEAIGTGGAQYVEYVIQNLDTTKNYKISCKGKKIIQGTDGKPWLKVAVRGSNDGTTYTGELASKTIQEVVVNQEYKLIPSQVVTGYPYYKIYLYNNAGTPVTIGEKTQYYDIQFEEGSTATDFEQFCGGVPSPNPEFPQPIENVEGRSCTNLFNKNGDFNYPTNVYVNATTLLEDGTIQTTANAQSSASRGLRLFLKPNTDYVVSGKLLSSTGTGYTSKARVRLMGYETNWRALSEKGLNGIGDFSFSFNSGDNTDWFLSLNVIGTIGNNYVAIYDEIQINEGSTALPYEEYFEGKRLELNVCNKQLFNKNDYLFYRGYIVSSSNTTIHYESNNYMVYIPCKTNTNYTISKIITKRFAVGYTTEIPTDGVILQNVTMKNDSDTSISIQTGNDAQYLVAYIRNGNIAGESSLENIINSLQIEQGSTATSYEEHKEQMIPFPLAEGQKLMEGDYLAEDGVHHVRGKIVFDGSEDETWGRSGSLAVFYNDDIANIAKVNGDYLCDHFTKIPNNSPTANMNSGETKFNTTSSTRLFFKYNDAETVTAFKEWLATHNIILEYDLAEETIEPYTPAQQEAYNKLKQAKSYNEVTHITQVTDSLPAILNVVALKNI